MLDYSVERLYLVLKSDYSYSDLCNSFYRAVSLLYGVISVIDRRNSHHYSVMFSCVLVFLY